jgi:hypothetical protein
MATFAEVFPTKFNNAFSGTVLHTGGAVSFPDGNAPVSVLQSVSVATTAMFGK